MGDNGKPGLMPNNKRSGRLPTKFNSLLSIWYGIIFGSLTLYLIVQNVRRFVYYAEFPWPYQTTPSDELNVYIALIGGAVVLLPFFLTASILKVGNSANDNRQLGKHLSTRDEWSSSLLPDMLHQGNSGFWRTIWTHSGPSSSLVHVISSFLLLLPQTLMEAVLIKNNFLPEENIWKTEMDVMLSHSARDKILQALHIRPITEEPNVNGASLERGFFSLPFASNQSLSPEFCNFALALVIFSVRYAQVFWHSSKSFTILFSSQLLLNSFHALVSFCNLTLLYKLHVFGQEKVIHHARVPFLLNHQITLLLYGISATILLASSSVLYHYGYSQISTYVRHKLQSQYVCPRDAVILNDYEGTGLGWTYFPHCAAFAVLLALASTQSPMVHDATQLYYHTLDNCALLYVISSATHFLMWIILWLKLTAEDKWEFAINVHIGGVQVKGLEPLRLVADIALASSSSQPPNPLSSAMLVLSEGQAFSVHDVNSKRSIMESLMHRAQIAIAAPEGIENKHQQETKEVEERVYWAKPTLKSCIRNSLDEEEKASLMANERKDYVTPIRNKVAFSDDMPSGRRLSRPVEAIYTSRDCFSVPNMYSDGTGSDEGDYAILKKCGKTTLMKHLLTSQSDYEEHTHMMQQDMPKQCSTPDSGYTGKASSDSSRSTGSSAASPSDRTVSSECSSNGINSNYCSTANCEMIYGTKEQFPIPTAEYLTYDKVYSPIQSIYETRASMANKNSPRSKSVYEASSSSTSPFPCNNIESGRNSVYGILTSGRNPNLSIASPNEILNQQQRQSSFNRSSSFRQSTMSASTYLSPGRQSGMGTPNSMCGSNSDEGYNDHPLPPIPPPLPPLSIMMNSPSTSAQSQQQHQQQQQIQLQTKRVQIMNADGLRRSSSFRNPSRTVTFRADMNQCQGSLSTLQ